MGHHPLCSALLNSIGPLQSPHIGDDVAHFLLCDTFDRRHVAERPVVRAGAVLCGHEEGLVAVVVGLVDWVDQRWSDTILPSGISAVTGGTIFVESHFAFFSAAESSGTVTETSGGPLPGTAFDGDWLL